MTYALLDLVFLVVVTIVAIAASAVRRRRGEPGRGRALLLALVVLILMTAVFDNVLIALRIVAYDPTTISGLFVGIAPVEDFAYAVAALVLLPAVWTLLPRRARVGESR